MAVIRANILLLIIFMAGCATDTDIRYITVRLPMPERPVLPPITAAETACLTDDVYARVLEREQLARHYAETLEEIIGTNNESATLKQAGSH